MTNNIKKKKDKSNVCPVCNGASFLIHKLPDVDLYRCCFCNHCYSLVNVEEQYDELYYEDVHKNWFENPNITLFEKIYSLINKSGSKKILDVGCGKADLLKFLYAKDANLLLTGVDLSSNKSTDGVELIQGDIFHVKLTGQFDVITSLAAIEHIEKPHDFVQRLVSLASPGGMIVVMTLNESSILYKASKLLYRLGLKSPMLRLYDKHHINHYNISSLKKIMTVNGLKINKVIRHNAPMRAIDFPKSSYKILDEVLYFGVWGIFMLGKLTGMTYLQTVVAVKE